MLDYFVIRKKELPKHSPRSMANNRKAEIFHDLFSANYKRACAILTIMISWQSVIINSFWIFGLSTMLAAFSYHYWLAAQQNRQLRLQLSERGFLRSFWLGLILIGIGLIGTSQHIWEMVIWCVLTLIAFFIFIGLIR